MEILVVDDHPLLRAGLECLLEGAGDLHVVATAASGEQALELARRLSPDLVLMDVSLPGMDGVAATELLCALRPPPCVVMLTSTCSAILVQAAFDAGASGYLLKDLPPDRLVAALHGLQHGRPAIDPRAMRILRRQQRADELAPQPSAGAAVTSVD